MKESQKEIYARIWDENFVSVRRFCHAKLKNRPEDADDMLYHAFGLLWEKIVTDGAPPNPKAWLLATVNNLASMEYRRTARDTEYRTADGFDEILHTNRFTQDVAETYEREENNAELWRIVHEELTDNEKLLLHYSEVEGLSGEQISQKLGRNFNTTRVQLSRARSKLREIKLKKSLS